MELKIYSITEFAKPHEVFRCIEREQNIAALLESGEGPEHMARYSIIAWNPEGYVNFKNGKASGSIVGDFEDPLQPLAKLLKNSKFYSNIPAFFKGGVIGYVSYDAIKYWEKIKNLTTEIENWPDLEFFVPKDFIIYDHKEGKVYVIGELPSKVECKDIDNLNTKFIGESLNKEEYKKIVNEALEYIKSGYIFQVVLSRFYRYEIKGDLMRFYYNLRILNPSPYMFYLKFWNRAIIGSSPETLFKVREGIAETYPIAGTRPRGSNIEEDLLLERELINSEKDKAEHIMLVDLARNDLGKVCVPGSVKVPEFMYVEKYSHVQHLVSKVIGILKKSSSSFDVLKATFPAGTVSGAPKPMAMNLIEKFELYKRGPYAGGIGFFSPNGDAEFAILIRSGFINGEVLRVQAGAGIVYDSVPDLEFLETEYKLKALKVALGVDNGSNFNNR
jgi:anthranilate synthase component 1